MSCCRGDCEAKPWSQSWHHWAWATSPCCNAGTAVRSPIAHQVPSRVPGSPSRVLSPTLLLVTPSTCVTPMGPALPPHVLSGTPGPTLLLSFRIHLP
jgi:hypothetical protein